MHGSASRTISEMALPSKALNNIPFEPVPPTMNALLHPGKFPIIGKPSLETGRNPATWRMIEH